jgi:hypothetical protein
MKSIPRLQGRQSYLWVEAELNSGTRKFGNIARGKDEVGANTDLNV